MDTFSSGMMTVLQLHAICSARSAPKHLTCGAAGFFGDTAFTCSRRTSSSSNSDSNDSDSAATAVDTSR
jgi:hypothetical protein